METTIPDDEKLFEIKRKRRLQAAGVEDTGQKYDEENETEFVSRLVKEASAAPERTDELFEHDKNDMGFKMDRFDLSEEIKEGRFDDSGNFTFDRKDKRIKKRRDLLYEDDEDEDDERRKIKKKFENADFRFGENEKKMKFRNSKNEYSSEDESSDDDVEDNWLNTIDDGIGGSAFKTQEELDRVLAIREKNEKAILEDSLIKKKSKNELINELIKKFKIESETVSDIMRRIRSEGENKLNSKIEKDGDAKIKNKNKILKKKLDVEFSSQLDAITELCTDLLLRFGLDNVYEMTKNDFVELLDETG